MLSEYIQLRQCLSKNKPSYLCTHYYIHGPYSTQCNEWLPLCVCEDILYLLSNSDKTRQAPLGFHWKLCEGQTEDFTLYNDVSQCWLQDHVPSSNGDTTQSGIKSCLSLEESVGHHHIPLMASLWKRPQGKQQNYGKKIKMESTRTASLSLVLALSRCLARGCAQCPLAQLVLCHPTEGKPHDRAQPDNTSPRVSVTARSQQKEETRMAVDDASARANVMACGYMHVLVFASALVCVRGGKLKGS